MTEQKIPDGSVDIVDKVRKLEAFLDAFFDHRVFRNPDGELEAFDIPDGQEYPEFFYDSDGDLIQEIYDKYDGDVSFSDWLNEQLFIDVCYERTDDTKQDRNFNWVQLYRVSGWSIDITCGGPTVRLKRDPFRGGYTYIHSWGVSPFCSASGWQYPEKTSIEFSPIIGNRIHEYIQEMYL
jgi:hypothetical protein